jgi:hypothetical protein
VEGQALVQHPSSKCAVHGSTNTAFPSQLSHLVPQHQHARQEECQQVSESNQQTANENVHTLAVLRKHITNLQNNL